MRREDDSVLIHHINLACAWMDPRICDGTPWIGDLVENNPVATLLPPALWSKSSVVDLPTLKLCHVSTASAKFDRL